MAGFSRVHEKRRRTGAGQGGGDLVADVPRLAHADHHYPAFAGQDQLACLDEIGVDVGQQALNRLEFETDGALRGLDQVAGLAHVENRIA
ncbi:hypothetical protein D3C76_1186780 [compost metagenome]